MATAGLEECGLDTSHTESSNTHTGTLTSYARLAHITDHKPWMTQIMQNGNKPADWLQYLKTVEDNWSSSDNSERLLFLDQLYRKARERIPLVDNKCNEALATIFINSAHVKLQLKCEGKARYLLRYTRANFRDIPDVHLAAAQFELDQGDRQKAISILEKGVHLCPKSEKIVEALRRARNDSMRNLTAKGDFTERATIGSGLTAELQADKAPDKPVERSPTDDQVDQAHRNFNHADSSAFSKVTSTVVKAKPLSSTQTVTPSHGPQITHFGKGALSTDRYQSSFKRPVSTSKTRSLPQRVIRQKLVLKSPDSDDDDDEDDDRDHDDRLEDSVKPLLSPPDRLMPDVPTELSVISEDADSGITVETPPTDDLRVDSQEGKPRFSFQNSLESIKEASKNKNRVEFKEVDRPKKQLTLANAVIAPDTSDRGRVSKVEPVKTGSRVSSSMQGPSQLVEPAVPANVPCPSDRRNKVVIKGVVYSIIKVIGKGGSSKVYQVLHETSKKIFAVKYVDLECADDLIIQSYKNEITVLQRLQNKEPIIKLYDFEIAHSHIYLVMECGSIDLASFLRRKRVQKEDILFYWRQMLMAVQCIHDEGIIHRDLKPANFLFVEGTLKLIDFGIANSIQSDRTSITRESQVGTLNYMSPETIQNSGDGPGDSKSMKINCKSDVWSLGCILYYIIYGKTPFQQLTNTMMKLQAICNSDYKIQFPAISDVNLADVVKSCLVRDVKKRPSIKELLEHPFVTLKSKVDEPPAPILGTTTKNTEIQSLMSKLSDAQCTSPRSMELALALQKYLGSHHDVSNLNKENRKPLQEANSSRKEGQPMNMFFHH